MLRQLAYSLLLSCLLWTRLAAGLSVNRTIDDELGDVVTGLQPLYSPDSVWNQGAQCTRCTIKPDVSQTFDSTWHDATYSPGQADVEVRATFAGTAVYVYFLVPGTFAATTTFMNTSFFIDDELVGQFVNMPHAAADISYRVPVYTNNSLSNSGHTLVMRATGTNASLILFDYIVYTAEIADTSSVSSTPSPTPTSLASPTSPTSSPSHAPVAAIAGGTVGGVVLLAIIAAIAFFLLRRRRPQHHKPESIFSVGVPGSKSDDEMLGQGSPGYKPGPQSPSFLPAAASITYYGAPRSPDESQGYESPHRQSFHMTRVPSVSGASTTEQQAELMQRIRALEGQIAGDMQSSKMARMSREAGHVATSPTDRSLQDEIAALRGALDGLRTQLASEGRSGLEPLPRYEAEMHWD
ncbi:hypothetical protein C8T65DRAFT_645758 [Cerioporus squamosus]|nr:hypothetical protein C8T65DRAFT_645758 [Cerioporus squamosus]